MSITYEFKIKNEVLKTTVINTVAQLDQCLSDFLSMIRQEAHQRVVGLDIGKVFKPYQSFAGSGSVNNHVAEKVAILKLCHGNSCLIIQLLHLKDAPCSLSNFLQLNWITFVGVGIKYCLEALDRDYGIKCRNAVDVGWLVFKKESYSGYGLLYMAKFFFATNSEVNKMMSSPEVGGLSNWGATTLSEQQIEAATLEALVCFKVGNHLKKKQLPLSSYVFY